MRRRVLGSPHQGIKESEEAIVAHGELIGNGVRVVVIVIVLMGRRRRRHRVRVGGIGIGWWWWWWGWGWIMVDLGLWVALPPPSIIT